MQIVSQWLRLGGVAMAVSLACAAGAAQAQINVGVIVSTTGPGASLGIPAEQSFKLWPDTLAGQKMTMIILNDGTDSNMAARNTSKLINEDKVDIIIGSSTTPNSIPVVEEAGRQGVPVITLSGGKATVMPQEGPRTWAFKLSPTEAISTRRVMDHMLKQGKKRMATIGLANSYGEGFLEVVREIAPEKGIELVAAEKYNATDQSVTAQVLKVLASKPDAVFILSSGTPGALPQIELAERGFKGLVYQTQGVANNDFLRVGGKSLEGSFMTVAPVLVADQLPDDNPTKKAGLEYLAKWDARYGAETRSLFGATAWDAMLLTEAASREALKTTKPGTPEFRKALRDAMEGMQGFVGTEGVYNMTPQDHNGVDETSQVLVTIENGDWKYVE
ncbi:MAG: ABC transporter substrate-binding protein [Pigmentiphaga sp.]|nr:ABC transporter substrate-binding protein [Pigmentiphaga sp.]